ncbi:hypothetical protein DF107_09150 [Burkholderia stagnalis]|nr:hypothetical protein DF161_20460 [Burkholderia stagnalis]RQR03976.1 hypothetical protein DF031_04535 [Burkholderia stagnalis]RQX93782.1 hypothetical protein DF120_10285 [Burkholderia stagnalis]RQY83018.1 hypothetical protein DF107_09150 [Burkholderia stagnalis]
MRVEAVDVAGAAPPVGDDADALLADMQAAAPSAAERVTRRANLIRQQHQDFTEIRALALASARAGDPVAARAVWRSAEALAVCWPRLLMAVERGLE